MDNNQPVFLKPSRLEQSLNGLLGFFFGLGLGPSYGFLLQVTGRKTGRLYSTPVNLLEYQGKQYLVAPRGETQWVRNARANGTLWLKRGASRRQYRIHNIDGTLKLELLKQYLDRYKAAVQRYFPVPAGSAAAAFSAIAANYPVFELTSDNASR
jgi:deazaflavin-dependent oxidoreductase (nitroreductase family)